MLIEGNKIALFTDVMPSEQGTQIAQDMLMYTSVLFSADSKYFKNIKQYKFLRAKGRESTSKKICKLLNEDKIWIIPTCVTCQVDIAEANGKQLISEILNTDIETLNKGKKLILNGHSISFKRAMMYANYAIALSILSIRMSSMIKHYNAKSGHFILDLLPGDQMERSKQPGMEILKWITDGSEFLRNIWKESSEYCKTDDIGFSYAKFDNDYGYVISDWVAQSLHASVNVETFRGNIQIDKENRRRVTADLAFAIFEQHKRRGIDPVKILKKLPLISSFKWNPK